MSLRSRLLAGMVALVAAGLAVAAVATYEEQRSFLLARVDQQVQSALAPLSFALRLPGQRFGSAAGGRRPRPRTRLPGRHFPGPGLRADLPPGTFGALVSSSGHVLRRRTFSYGQTSAAAPRLPARPPVSRPGAPLKLFTVQSAGSAPARYRAAAFAVGSDIAVVAVPLRETQDTLHRLVVVEALVGAGVIIALIALGWGVIRVGLRPLRRIGRVAAEIAEGDLSRRVTPDNERTEVGQLGGALNEMLAQIERAFRDRRASELRLRRFLADASHELRTPLASIRGYAELFRLGATEQPGALERAMAGIESEAARMGVLVEDLLALAALDEAPQGRRVPVDVCTLAAHAAEDTRMLAPDRPVSLIGDGPAVVLGDPELLRRLLSNLTRNAVIHTPAQTAIELSCTDGDGQVTVAVRDHGRGLPVDDPEQLFERFWRAEGGRSRGRGGAGLGLAIARGIARAHGGDLRGESPAGGGARFVVTLPRAAADDSQQTLSLLTTDS